VSLLNLDAPTLTIPGWRKAADGLYSAGQPEPAHWVALAVAGLRGVLNLRPPIEQPGRDESQEVAAAGLAYAALPIADAASLGRESAAALDQALRRLPTPLLVHCASGNRVGALVALREAWFAGADPQTALARGRAAGLAGLEPQIRRQLGLPDLAG
jgi:uncharacterized protein (TIGR01244 family)